MQSPSGCGKLPSTTEGHIVSWEQKPEARVDTVSWQKKAINNALFYKHMYGIYA